MTLSNPVSPALHDAVDAAIASIEADGSYMRGPKLPQQRRRSKTRRDRSRAKRRKR